MTEVWNLRKGELFRIPGCPIIWEFGGMDGMYARAFTRSGQMLNLTGTVEVFE